MSLRTSVVLLVAALYMSLRVLLSNADKFPHIERLLLIVAVYWLLGGGFYLVARRFGTDDTAASLGAAMWVVLVSSGRNLTRYLPWVFALGLTILVGALITYVFQRLGRGAQRVSVGALIVFLAAGMLGTALEAFDEDPPNASVLIGESSLPTSLSRSPDVFLVVLDGMVGDVALDMIYNVQLPAPAPGPQRTSGWASYPISLASVTSILDMGYPLQTGAILAGALRSDLANRIAGDNRVVEALASEGYTTTLVESGWSRSYCGEGIDVCITSPFLDEGTFEVLRQSVMGLPLVESTGSPFTIGAENAMSWLMENTAVLASDDKPDFVFATVLAPHPPLFLDDGCQFRYEHWLSGNSMHLGGYAAQQREQAYVEQVLCAFEFEATLLGEVQPDDVVIIIADHGSDKEGQLGKHWAAWSDDERIERMNVHIAAQLPQGCVLREPALLVHLMRDVLYCLSAEPTPAPLEERVFVSSLVDDPKVLEIVELNERLRTELLEVGAQ